MLFDAAMLLVPILAHFLLQVNKNFDIVVIISAVDTKVENCYNSVKLDSKRG
jgi:hypothetical protein